MNQPLVDVTALLSALAAATSSVLQHRSTQQVATARAHRLLRLVVTRPAWVAGLLAAVAGLGLHAYALANGQLAVVQPLLISGILFALPLSALLERRRPSAIELLWALALVGGLTGFVLAARPSAGRVSLDADILALVTVAGVVVAGGLAVVGWHNHGGRSSVLLGTAGGIGFGVDAALLKQVTRVAQSGIPHLLGDWPLYDFMAMGAGALTATQLGYRSGPLSGSMPALTISDPAVAIAIGALAFQERLAGDPLSVAGQLVGFLVMAAAATQLARRGAGGGREPPTTSDPRPDRMRRPSAGSLT